MRCTRQSPVACRQSPVWKEALERLLRVDASWSDATLRCGGLADCREWFAQQPLLPRLSRLARLLDPQMSRRQFWSVLVPVEREVARRKVTDVEILDADLPDGPAAGVAMPLTVVVDSLRSAFNVGGVFRTAECLGAAEVILCGYTALPDQTQVAKAALGADKLVPWHYAEDIRGVIKELRQAGTLCLALETVAGAPEIAECAWRFPCALVLGNERFGIDREVVALCDGAVRIRMYGRKNSLNVVTAFALAAREAREHFDLRAISLPIAATSTTETRHN
ncbi:MAG: TrmH family RNA methyltransferase [Kiritimatiellae bacterium]|nr:TrmH family RNA methyltransferase [Kiritimatiellia bacterium]